MQEYFELPLLPLLNVVFFPKIAAPITLTDPSYIAMIKDCVREQRAIAVTYAKPIENPFGRTAYYPHPICTLAVATIVSEREGELSVLLQGVTRIEIGKMVANTPYAIFQAKISPAIDDFSLLEAKLVPLWNLFSRWCDVMIRDELDRDMFRSYVSSPIHLIDYISGYMVNDVALKQILLECDSLSERVILLRTLFSQNDPLHLNTLSALSIKDFESKDFSLKAA